MSVEPSARSIVAHLAPLADEPIYVGWQSAPKRRILGPSVAIRLAARRVAGKLWRAWHA